MAICTARRDEAQDCFAIVGPEGQGEGYNDKDDGEGGGHATQPHRVDLRVPVLRLSCSSSQSFTAPRR
ncbi:hypothetical protein IT41_16565 [Paracoccus halophilus]|uniref:Uncharacterized protein n=1 Tax=Paracoccus halophilus TaxID=376733 RepID=A0A099EWX6_9RHOB|nr:hypothetical protein IT41_16565 [Paracoccus halophilus]